MERGGEGGEDRPAAGMTFLAIGFLALSAAAALGAGAHLIVLEHARIVVALWFLSAGMAFAMLLLLTRRTRVAASAVLAALGGVSLAEIVLALAGMPRGAPATAFALGVAMAAYFANAYIGEILADCPPGTAARRARWSALPVALGATALAIALPFAGLVDSGDTARLTIVSLAAELCLTLLFVAGALPITLTLWNYSERFIAETNRRRERRMRRAYRASMVSVPRWGMSISGIALVFAVLAFFSAGPSVTAGDTGRFLLVQVLVTFVISLVAGAWLTAAWRETVAIVLSAIFLQLLVVAFASRAPTGGVVFPGGAFAAIPISFLAVLVVARHARYLRADGDESQIARLKGIEEELNPVVYATAAAIGALLLWPFVDIATLLLLVLGAMLAVVVTPAFATTIETLLPRRRSVEELYSRR